MDEEENSGGKMEASESCETPSAPVPLPASDSSSVTAGVKQVSPKTDTSAALNDSIKNMLIKNKWNLGLGIAPAITYSKLEENTNGQLISGYRNSSDKKLLTWNYHFTISYKFFPELGIYSGIGIVSFGQKILSRQLVYHYDTTYNSVLTGSSPPIITIGKSYININGDSTGMVENKITYLQIPIGISYDLLPGEKFSVCLLPEVSFNKYISTESYLYNFRSFNYEKTGDGDMQSWMISYGIGISFRYLFTENFALAITPRYSGFQKSTYSSSYPLTQRFQQAEFQFSFHYLLK
jgi:hypothetical protein